MIVKIHSEIDYRISLFLNLNNRNRKQTAYPTSSSNSTTMSTPNSASSGSSKRPSPQSAFASAGKAKSRRRINFNQNRDNDNQDQNSNAATPTSARKKKPNEKCKTRNNAIIQIVTPDPQFNFDLDEDSDNYDSCIHGFSLQPMPGKPNTVWCYPLFFTRENPAKQKFFNTTLAHNLWYHIIDSTTGKMAMYRGNNNIEYEYKGYIFTTEDPKVVTKEKVQEHVNECLMPALLQAKKDNIYHGQWKLYCQPDEYINIVDMNEAETVHEVHYWKDILETDEACVRLVTKHLSNQYEKDNAMAECPNFKTWCTYNPNYIYQLWRPGNIPAAIIEEHSLDATCMNAEDWKAYCESIGENPDNDNSDSD